jgi:phage I-like protein
MSREAHVRNCEGVGVRFPHATRLLVVVDYEHQTLSGHKAPAAGWIKELTARDDGLWARVAWTDAARGHLAAREYRYFSPVLRLEPETRRPLALLHAALTNTPAINGLALPRSSEVGPPCMAFMISCRDSQLEL